MGEHGRRMESPFPSGLRTKKVYPQKPKEKKEQKKETEKEKRGKKEEKNGIRHSGFYF